MMTLRYLLFTFLFVASVSANDCCRGFKIFQFRRPNILPMYGPPPPCEDVFDNPEPYCESSLYQAEPKYEIPRCYSSYMDPKPVAPKCVCSKSMTTHRLMPIFPRCYKRSYCSDPMMDEFGLRSLAPCSQCGCGQCNECQFNPCGPCNQYSPCGMPPPMFRPPPPPPPPRVLPLTLPPSCVC